MRIFSNTKETNFHDIFDWSILTEHNKQFFVVFHEVLVYFCLIIELFSFFYAAQGFNHSLPPLKGLTNKNTHFGLCVFSFLSTDFTKGVDFLFRDFLNLFFSSIDTWEYSVYIYNIYTYVMLFVKSII